MGFLSSIHYAQNQGGLTVGWDEKHLDVLQNIELAIVSVFSEHADLRDREVMHALDAAVAHYRAVGRGHVPTPDRITGQAAEVLDHIYATCEYRLDRGSLEPVEAEQRLPPGTEKTTEEILFCLRKIRKSVERWSNQAGPQGYLQFVRQYVR
ncbi:MAG: hypothetical protein ACREYF_01710 [Gammaproteobacteria bacterium]